MIKIVSGVTLPGGSTIAHVRLCRLFNEHGHPCTLYGPHDWHLDKCPSARLAELEFAPDDKVLVHNIDLARLGKRPAVDSLILTCHETTGYPLRMMDLSALDLIHFVSESQRAWHAVQHPSVVIPNVVDPLQPSRRKADGQRIAGVIGHIDPHKQTHLSIQRALDGGCSQVLLFGNIMNREYFSNTVLPTAQKYPGRVIHMGYLSDRQAIYDAVDVVYHSSIAETFNFVRMECVMTGTPYEGLASGDTDARLASPDEIFHAWADVLGLPVS
jgi:hypothetical protein